MCVFSPGWKRFLWVSVARLPSSDEVAPGRQTFPWCCVHQSTASKPPPDPRATTHATELRLESTPHSPVSHTTEWVSMSTHTHPFNGPLSGTTRVSRYQKGKTNPDFTEARDSEWQWHQLGYIQVCTALQTDNHASTTPLKFFYRPDALPAAQPTASKHWRDRVSMSNT